MIRIVTDGACAGNPGPGGWAALITRDGQTEEIAGSEPETTNNRMEMRAAIEGLRRVPPDAPVTLVTDSEYLLKGITQWVRGWKRRGWVTASGTPVLNRDLWEELDTLAGARVKWEHVRGHAGHPENERANILAQAHSQSAKAAGASGRPASRPEPKAPASAQLAAGRFSAGRPSGGWPDSGRPAGRATYLSLVDGRLERHGTWGSCELRVKGTKGARFKKCASREEEIATLRGWGVDPARLERLAAGREE